MNQSHRRTLAAIFEDPVRTGIPWRDVESMLKALGARATEGAGSRVRFTFRAAPPFHTHRPHPRKETKPYVVRELRAFLDANGFRPEDI